MITRHTGRWWLDRVLEVFLAAVLILFVVVFWRWWSGDISNIDVGPGMTFLGFFFMSALAVRTFAGKTPNRNPAQLLESSEISTQPAVIEDRRFTSVPAQLPADIADFVGRETQIDDAVANLQGNTISEAAAAPICIIAGMPGVGKTALANHVAHILRDRFPDGQLQVDLKGASDQPADPISVLQSILRSLMPIDNLGLAHLDDSIGAYRSALSGKRILILLDNARDETQIRPLLPSDRSCAVLITSRNALGGLEGATRIALQEMSSAEAVDLLGRLIGLAGTEREVEAVHELARLCGYLPLALRITGARFAADRNRTLADEVQRLADERRRLERFQYSDLDVRASFNLSYQQIKDTTDGRILRMFGLLPGREFASETAAAMLEVDPVLAKDAVDRLVNIHLLQSKGSGRYAFHDLMRLFVKEQAGDDEEEVQKVARLGAALWYAQESSQWMRLLDPAQRQPIVEERIASSGGSALAISYDLFLQAVDWFSSEWENVAAAAQWAFEDREWEQTWRLSFNLVPFFAMRAQWQDWSRVGHLALEAARHANDLANEALANNKLGALFSEQHDYRKAISYYESALTNTRATGDQRGTSTVLMNLGNLYMGCDDLDKSEEYYREALLLLADSGIVDEAGTIQMNIANIQQSRGDWVGARARYEEAVEILRGSGNFLVLAQAWTNLGNVCIRSGDLARGMRNYSRARRSFRRLHDIRGEAHALSGLGSYCMSKRRWDRAVRYFNKAIDAATKIGDRTMVGSVLINLSNAYFRQANAPKAEEYANEAKMLYNALNDFNGRAQAIRCLANVRLLQDRPRDALDLYREDLQLRRETNDEQGEGESLANIAIILARYGQKEEAKALWDEALTKLHPDSEIYRALKQRMSQAKMER